MNKKVIGFLLALPALMGFGLTSCSEEATLAVNEPSQDKLVDVTVTASLADLTRASLTPEKDVIKFEWNMNDVITVVNADNGKYLGTLTVNEIQESDHRVCKFKGAAAIPAGKVNLNFFYLGKDQKATLAKDLTVEDYSVDFSKQNGSADSFSANDVLISTGKFNNVQDGNLGMINFGRDFAYARFILKYNGEEINLAGKTVTISANTGKLYNKATLNFKTASYSYEEGTIEVTPASNDFYVSFPESEGVNLKFEVNEFDGTKMEKLVADTYYIRNAEGEPIIVEMRHTDGSDDQQTFKLIYKSNYEGGPADVEFTWKAVSPYSYTVRTYQKAFDSKDLGLDLIREGYEFTGWNTQADGNGQSYAAGDKFEVTYPDNTTGTLYAQWKEKTYQWQFKFIDDPEVGTVSYGAVIEPGASPKTMQSSFPTDNPNGQFYHKNVKEGYTFLGWEYNGKMVGMNGNTYLASDIVATIENAEKIELGGKETYRVYIYAKWEKLPDPTTITNPGYGHGEFN